MRTLWLAAVAGVALNVSSAAQAKQAPPEKLTLERVFGNPALSGPTPRAVKLSPDGRYLTLLRPRPDDRERFDLWAVDTTTGTDRMVVDSTAIGSGAELSEAEKMQRERARIGGSKGIVGYDWSPDARTLLVPLDGDLFVAGLDGQTRRLTATPQGELNAAISPKGRYASFVRDQNLVVRDLTTGTERAATTDGKGTVHWGEAEFVAQEEMDRFTGYWWSPDDARIAVERFDEAPVGIVSRAAIGADGTKVYDQRYPAAGTPNARVDLYVMRPDGSGRVKVDLGADADIYLARVDWTPDGKALLVQRQSRDQKRLDLLRVDPATGAATPLFSETSATWVDLTHDLRALADGSVLWSSTRDGHRHLYRLAQGKWTQLTQGPWEVAGVIGVDEAAGRVFFTANRDDVLERQVYTLDLAKPEAMTRLTERGFWNDAMMDKAATRMIVTRSSPDQPPQLYLSDATGKRLAWISENALVPGHPYYPFAAAHRPTQFGTLNAADGTVLHWKMIAPALKRGKRYPVFFEHYGGPTVQTVARNWGGPLHQYLVQRGWIVFELDNRGSANRGDDFARPLYHAMGGVEVDDQVAGATWLKAQRYVDPARIATYGWSYGGYLSLKLLERAPGVFAAAVAGAPVTRWELYDTHYTERYLGDPRVAKDSYARADALADAVTIRDPLLLVHGMSDDNVVFDNSTALMARLQAAAVPFETMLYPGQTHRVAGPGVSVHLWRTILDFLDRRTAAARLP